MRTTRYFFILVIGLLWVAATPVALAHTAFNVIPEPQHLTAGQGVFVLHSGERIQAPADHRAQWIADFLRDHVANETGVSLKVVKAPSHGSIVLRIDSSINNKAAYHLTVTPAKVVIAAKDNRGLFWGVQTLRQLLPLHHKQHVAIPAVRIKDAPRYSWRGVMLDVGRHFYPVSFVKKQIALMSYYKFDVFHWHLTEDQGWRIQIKRYPKLTSVGAWRTEPDGKRYGGFYTQQQIRDVVAYARKRNVMVMPEIEMPGHSSAAIAAYPDLSCNDKPIEVPTGWGVFRNANCPIKTSTYKFLENVLDEVMQLFPSPYVGIGGDEVPAGVWSKCAACQKFAKEHGLASGEKGLHSYFVRRIGKYLRSKGRTLVGWDEIMEGRDTSPDDVVEVWHVGGMAGNAVMQKALANGNRVVFAGPFYLNFPIDKVTLKDLYRARPFANPLFKKYPGKVLGGEAALWSEQATPLNGAARLYPRLFAISEDFWGKKQGTWADFQKSVRAQEAWLTTQHVAYGPENKDIVDYHVFYSPGYRGRHYPRWRIRAARGFGNLRLHYTLNGSQPTAKSPWFKDVLDLYHPAKVTVAPFRGSVQYQASATFDFVSNLALGDPVTSTAPPIRGKDSQLTDGILGSANLDGLIAHHRWVVWPKSGMDAIVDLGRIEPIHSIEADFIQSGGSRAVVPPSVIFQISKNGKTWSTVEKSGLSVSYAKRGVVAIHRVEHQMHPSMQVRYVRVIATNPKYGHVFSDEIIVR